MTGGHLTDCAGAEGGSRPCGAGRTLPDLADTDYSDLPELEFLAREGARAEAVEVAERGWTGFTDQYWMTELIPTPGHPLTAVTKYAANANIFQTEARLPPVTATPYRV